MISLTNDQFQAKFKTAPYAVRDFVMGVELEDFVASAGSKYQLHVDTLGKFSDVVTALLLGFITPTQLPKELSELGINSTNINTLTQDLNEKVFKPLREKIQTEDTQGIEASTGVLEKTNLTTVSSQTKTFEPAQPTQKQNLSRPQPSATSVPQAPRPQSFQPAPTLRPVSAPVVPQQPRPQAPQAVVRPQTPPQVRPAVSVPPEPKPTSPVFAPFPKAAPPPPQPAPVAPAPRTAEEITSTRPAIRTMMRDADQAQHPAPTPQPVAPTQPKPITPPRIATAPVTTPSFNKTSTTPSPNAQELSDTLKKYGIDPYREPVE